MPGFEVMGEEEQREVLDVLSRKVLFRYEFHGVRQGVYKVEEFEKAFAEICGAGYALAVSSGTAALKVGLTALGIGPGDEVITTGFTFVATWEAILETGAVPVFAEIDETLCLDPSDIPNKITPRTRAILPVHMCGGHARVDKILEVAFQHGLPVLEDTAQACGGRFRGKALGSFGKCGAFSFDSVKTITTGEGGMLITDDRDLYIRASEYHDHGHDHDRSKGRGLEKHPAIGFNYRMMELQGAMGLAQLRKLPEIIRRQRENKARLRDSLGRMDGITFRFIPDPEGDIGSFLIFSLTDRQKTEAFAKVMAEAGSPPVVWFNNLWHYYGRWDHLLEGKSIIRSGYPFTTEAGHSRCRFEPGALPKTAEILSRCVTIPININMDQEIPKIQAALEKAARAV